MVLFRLVLYLLPAYSSRYYLFLHFLHSLRSSQGSLVLPWDYSLVASPHNRSVPLSHCWVYTWPLSFILFLSILIPWLIYLVILEVFDAHPYSPFAMSLLLASTY